MDDLPPLDLPPVRSMAVPPPTPTAPVEVAPLIRPLAGQLVARLAALEAAPIAVATPAERAAVLELHEILRAVNDACRTRIAAIEFAFRRGAEELKARKIPVEGWGDVHYTPDEGEWEVHGDALLEEFRALKRDGIVTDEDISKAFTVVTTIKVDNRVLNGLVGRGLPVQQAIERHRVRREGRPMAGRLTFPKRRKEAADAE